MPTAAVSNFRRRRLHDSSLQDGIPCTRHQPGTVCRAVMKGPVGTEDLSDHAGNVYQDQGASHRNRCGKRFSPGGQTRRQGVAKEQPFRPTLAFPGRASRSPALPALDSAEGSCRGLTQGGGACAGKAAHPNPRSAWRLAIFQATSGTRSCHAGSPAAIMRQTSRPVWPSRLSSLQSTPRMR
jgi:hypothetical protein